MALKLFEARKKSSTKERNKMEKQIRRKRLKMRCRDHYTHIFMFYQFKLMFFPFSRISFSSSFPRSPVLRSRFGRSSLSSPHSRQAKFIVQNLHLYRQVTHSFFCVLCIFELWVRFRASSLSIDSNRQYNDDPLQFFI